MFKKIGQDPWYMPYLALEPVLTGKHLEKFAKAYFGVHRRRVLWIFKESDRSLRKRCSALLEPRSEP